MTRQFSRTHSNPAPFDVHASAPRYDVGAGGAELETSFRATSRRLLGGTMMIVVLGLVAHAIAATYLTGFSLAVLAFAGLAGSVVGEANLRVHPRWATARDGRRAARRNEPYTPISHGGGSRHAA